MSEEKNPPDSVSSSEKTEPPSARRPQTRRKHRPHGDVNRGKITLVILFVALLAADLLLLAKAPSSRESAVIAGTVAQTVWTLALMVGIWMRQNWCRYVLAGLLLLAVIIGVIFSPPIVEFAQFIGQKSLVPIMLVGAVIYCTVALVLIYSPDVRRLAKMHN